jgi:cyclase
LRFGNQCIVLAIDAKRRTDGWWEVVVHGGRTPTGIDAVQWARQGVESGAGEILLTSMDRDGTRDGYDLELTEAIASVVNVPLIASGGAGSKQDFVDVFQKTQAEAALAATLFHDEILSIKELKDYLAQHQIPIRPN